MLSYVLRKLAYMPFIMLGVIAITFTLFFLVTSPESLAHGLFTVGPTKSFLGRLFGKKSAEAPPPVAAAPRRQRSAEEERRIRESRALVEEALGKG